MNSVPFGKLSEKMVVVKKFDILGNLPNEISFKILMPLAPQDIVNMFKCSQKWSRHMNFDYFWKSKYCDDYCAIDESGENDFHSKFIKKFSSVWQGRYLYNFGLKFNFENDNAKHIADASHRIFREQLKIVHFDDRRFIFYLDRQNKLYLVDSRSGWIDSILTHFRAIDSVIKDGDLLISLSHNNTILKVWNTETMKCLVDHHNITTDRFHNAFGSSIMRCKHLIIIAIRSLINGIWRLLVFDMNTNIIRNIVGYTDDVCCNGDIIAMSKRNGIVQITNANFEKMATVDCLTSTDTGFTSEIMMNNNYLVKITQEKYFKAAVWNIKTNAHFDITHRIGYKLISGNKLICMSNNRHWELWNLDTQNFVFRLDGTLSSCTTWNSNYLFTTVPHCPSNAVENNIEIRMWCLKTGRCLPSFRVRSSGPYNIMATERKVVFSNSTYSNKGRKTFSFDIFDYEANIKNHLKER